MTPLEQLKLILKEQYVTEDDEEYTVELKDGLSAEQINELANVLPSGQIPSEIRELLKFASGFDFLRLDEVTFDGVNQFGFENVFPYSIQLAGDGYGNFWILDVDDKGIWGNVFYVCHDPAVVVKHSEDLSEFIKHVDEFGKMGNNSNLDIIHEKIVNDIWNAPDGGFSEIKVAKNSNDKIVNDFAVTLPESFVIADLRNKPNQTGFAWGKFGPDIDKAVRYKDELLWAFEKKTKKGFFSKLFGG